MLILSYVRIALRVRIGHLQGQSPLQGIENTLAFFVANIRVCGGDGGKLLRFQNK